MNPMNGFVLVERVEEPGVIKIDNFDYSVVKVKNVPWRIPEDGLCFVDKNDLVLTTRLYEFIYGNTKYWFTKLEHVVCVL